MLFFYINYKYIFSYQKVQIKFVGKNVCFTKSRELTRVSNCKNTFLSTFLITLSIVECNYPILKFIEYSLAFPERKEYVKIKHRICDNKAVYYFPGSICMTLAEANLKSIFPTLLVYFAESHLGDKLLLICDSSLPKF